MRITISPRICGVKLERIHLQVWPRGGGGGGGGGGYLTKSPVFSELPYLDNIPQAIPREAEALFAEFAQFQPFYAQQALICREPQHVNF